MMLIHCYINQPYLMFILVRIKDREVLMMTTCQPLELLQFVWTLQHAVIKWGWRLDLFIMFFIIYQPDKEPLPE